MTLWLNGEKKAKRYYKILKTSNRSLREGCQWKLRLIGTRKKGDPYKLLVRYVAILEIKATQKKENLPNLPNELHDQFIRGQ